MSGAHHRPEANPLVSRRKGAGWLARLLLAVLLPLALLALLGLVIYVAVTVPAADGAIFIAVFGLFWIYAAVDVTRTLRQVAAPSPRRRLDRAEAVGFMLLTTLMLLRAISQQQGWTRGEVSSVTAWLVGAVVLLFAVYRLGGKRRLIAAMEKRAATRQGRPA